MFGECDELTLPLVSQDLSLWKRHAPRACRSTRKDEPKKENEKKTAK
jgi:hypothetical protein